VITNENKRYNVIFMFLRVGADVGKVDGVSLRFQRQVIRTEASNNQHRSTPYCK
jgi:hypothetical protein